LRWLWVGACSSCNEHNNAHLRSKNIRRFIGYLITYWPPAKKSRQFFEKITRISDFIITIRTVGDRRCYVSTDRQTDMTKLIVAISRTHLKNYSKC